MPKRTDILASIAVLACFVLIPTAGQSQGVDEAKKERWTTFGRICGKIVHRHEKKRKGNVVQEDFKDIRGAKVRLFRREIGVDCCQSAVLVSEVESGRHGTFTPKVEDGRYWLVVTVDGREHRMPVSQDKKHIKNDSACSDRLFAISDDGSFQVAEIVTVD